MKKANTALAPLERAVGTWTVTGSHPQMPGRTLPGKVTFERRRGVARRYEIEFHVRVGT